MWKYGEKRRGDRGSGPVKQRNKENARSSAPLGADHRWSTETSISLGSYQATCVFPHRTLNSLRFSAFEWFLSPTTRTTFQPEEAKVLIPFSKIEFDLMSVGP
jgi:hypothetical protein